MKTLREHLLEQSREAAPERELAAMRERVVGRLRDGLTSGASGDETMRSSSSILALLRTVWREIVWPCRGLWATIAAAWVAVLMLNHAGRAAEPDTLTRDDMVALQAIWREQRNLWAAAEAVSADSAAPRPDEKTGSGVQPLGWRPDRRGEDRVVT